MCCRRCWPNSPCAFRRSAWCCTRAIRPRWPSARPQARSTSGSRPRRWPSILVPTGHALTNERPLTLEAIARHPLVTYDFAFTGRSAINAAFAARGLETNVVLTALDTDVIKTYVAMGMGIGIIALMAYDPVKDAGFEMLDASHLFAASTTRLALRKGAFLRGFVYAFIALFAPQYSRAAVDAALAGTAAASDGL